MYKTKRKPKYPSPITKFNPETDKPLRYFSVEEAFVRFGEFGKCKLYCEQKYVPIYLQSDGFINIYPSFKTEYTPYVEAFLHDYAPNFPIEKAKRYIGKTHYEYIGNL